MKEEHPDRYTCVKQTINHQTQIISPFFFQKNIFPKIIHWNINTVSMILRSFSLSRTSTVRMVFSREQCLLADRLNHCIFCNQHMIDVSATHLSEIKPTCLCSWPNVATPKHLAFGLSFSKLWWSRRWMCKWHQNQIITNLTTGTKINTEI
jgi:hypothetical protein